MFFFFFCLKAQKGLLVSMECCASVCSKHRLLAFLKMCAERWESGVKSLSKVHFTPVNLKREEWHNGIVLGLAGSAFSHNRFMRRCCWAESVFSDDQLWGGWAGSHNAWVIFQGVQL